MDTVRQTWGYFKSKAVSDAILTVKSSSSVPIIGQLITCVMILLCGLRKSRSSSRILNVDDKTWGEQKIMINHVTSF